MEPNKVQSSPYSNEDLKSKFLRALVGTAVSDALGMPV